MLAIDPKETLEPEYAMATYQRTAVIQNIESTLHAGLIISNAVGINKTILMAGRAGYPLI